MLTIGSPVNIVGFRAVVYEPIKEQGVFRVPDIALIISDDDVANFSDIMQEGYADACDLPASLIPVLDFRDAVAIEKDGFRVPQGCVSAFQGMSQKPALSGMMVRF